MHKQTKIKISEHWLITPLSALRLNMGQGSGALTQKKIKTKLKWLRRAARWVSNDYPTYSSVTEIMSNLGWRSLDNRRYDARLLMFYKIVYGLVAIPVPSYFERPEVYTRHTHRFTLLYVTINTLFSPMTVVLWNRLPADLVLNPDLDSFKAGVRKINHAHP